MRPLVGFCLVFAAVGACASPPSRPQVRMPRLGVSFEKNTGRWPKQVEFVARTGQGTLFLTRREMVLALRGKGKAAALRLKLQGANPRVAAVGVKKLPGIVNYFLGNDPGKWRTNIPTYSGVRMAGIYPGIDLVTYGAGKGGALEYDFVVKPGADPRRIRLALSGAKSLKARNGALVASTACGDVLLNRPYAYQTVAGVRKQVACSYTLERNRVAFQVARYDTARPLVVDPVLEYSVCLGGVASEYGLGLCVDGSGAAYVTGYTFSAAFPTSSGAYSVSHNGGGNDAFVAKLGSGGTRLDFSTFLGGSGGDYGKGIAVDRTGAAYVAGQTYSTDYPSTVGAYDTSLDGSTDAVVTKLSPAGNVLAYSTFLGGAGHEDASDIAIDSDGSAFAVGCTQSTNFPTSVGAHDTTLIGGQDAFVTKLTPDGSSLTFSTYLGGTGWTTGTAIAIDSSSAVYITGIAGAGFPTTGGAYDISHNGYEDAFVTKLNTSGTGITYSTFLGGAYADFGLDIAVDGAGAAYVTGATQSSNFPTSTLAYDRSRNGNTDAFAAKLSPDAKTLAYSTFLGGSLADYGHAIAVDSNGAAHVAGQTASTDFPTSGGAFDPSNNGETDAFIIKITPDGRSLACGTYLGGASSDGANSIALDMTGDVYITGWTQSSGFPSTSAGFETSYAGGGDAFIAKIANALRMSTTITAIDTDGCVGDIVPLIALLSRSDTLVALAGKSIFFTVDGTPAGSMTSDLDGRAQVYYTVPSGASIRTIRASFAGDATFAPSAQAAVLTVNASVATSIFVPDRVGTVTGTVVLKGYLYRTVARTFIAGQAVSFSVAGTAVGSAVTDPGGQAQCAWTMDAGAVSRLIAVHYAGGGEFNPALAPAFWLHRQWRQRCTW